MTRAARHLLDAAVVIGALYAITFLVIALWRAPYPFEIEWMEGGMVSHAARLLDGQPIYAPPSADFVPFFYTPGYPLLLAGLAQLFGLTLGLGRAVSIAATLATLAILFFIGRREASWRHGALAAGLYAALFRTTGAFYDLARPDALFIALVAAATAVAYYRRSLPGAAAAGALFALAFLTKQTTSVFVPAVGLYLLWRAWRHALAFGLTAAALAGAGVALGTWLTDGWMWTYIFEGHQGHLFYWKNILLEYWRDVLFVAPLLLLLPLLWFGYKVPVAILSVLLAAHWTYAFIFRTTGFADFPHMYYRELWYLSPRWAFFVPPALIALLLALYRWQNPARGWRPPAHGFWLLMFVAGAGSSGLNHSTQWAYSNSLMPIALFASILIALAVRDLTEATAERTPRWSALVPLAVLVQLGAWVYDVPAQLPDAADRAALARLEARLAEIDGPIFFPAHPLWSWQRDGRVHVHQMGIQDVAFLGGVADLGPRLAKGEWAAVVVDAHNRVPGLGRAYVLAERFAYDGDALMTRTGFLTRPHELWLRRGATRPPRRPAAPR
ncbi:MAG: glycosyltransferase family 39 protein [Myxococcales bacterium]|nr:glycosyltransferase family 39 protein [Myxococcales bacterium]MCB9541075.1 glycosyltransferase family 39 protein [Myxococcales bacterium]